MNPNAELTGTGQSSNLLTTLKDSVHITGEELAGATAGAAIGSMGGPMCALAGGLIGAGIGALVSTPSASESPAIPRKKPLLRRKRVCVPGVWVSE